MSDDAEDAFYSFTKTLRKLKVISGSERSLLIDAFYFITIKGVVSPKWIRDAT